MNAPYINKLGRKHQVIRLVWNFTWTIFASWLPRSLGSGWKRFLLRLFGAKMSPHTYVYSSAKIYLPSNLIMEEYSCLASGVECYNVAPVILRRYSTVSQNSMLCTASHDINSPTHELLTAPIEIGEQAWVGTRAFVAMGVTIGKGAVVGAASSVFKDVDEWDVVGGNPAKFIKKRIIKE